MPYSKEKYESIYGEDPTKKRCLHCNVVKLREEFYNEVRNRDGKVGVCKSCTRKNELKKRKNRMPLERKASLIYRHAISIGFLTAPVYCDKCGYNKSVQGHHSDYSKPLEVEWLCKSCHQKIHRKNSFS